MHNTPQYSNDLHRLQENTIDLRGVLDLIKKNYQIILLTSLSFLLCGIYDASIQPPVYRSTALIQMKSSSTSNLLGASSGQSASSMLSLGQGSSSAVEAELMQSPYILGDVVRQMGFDISVSPKSTGILHHKKQAVFAKMSVLSVPNSLLAKKLTLVVLPNDRYQLLTPQGKTILIGSVGRLMQARYLSEPIKIQVDRLQGPSGAQLTVIKQPVVDVAAGLSHHFSIHQNADGWGTTTGIMQLSYDASSPEQAQNILNAILSTALIRDKEEQVAQASQMTTFINHQLPTLNSQLNTTENKINQLGIKTGIFDVKAEAQLLSENLVFLQESLRKLQTKKILLLQNFTLKHPLMIATNQEEAQLETQITNAKTALTRLPMLGQKEISLDRDYAMQEKVYEGMLASQQQIQMMKAGILSNLRILDSASYPVAPLTAKKRVIVLSSFVLGLLAGLCFIFARYVLSPVLADVDSVERELGISTPGVLPVSAILPFSQIQHNYNKKSQQSTDKAVFILSREYPKDVAVEGLRSLRTAVQMMLLETKGNVMAMTGCSPSAGKSFISSNLALLFSDLNKRILLIDADMRRGKLCQDFDVTKTPGLAEFLQEKSPLSHVIQSVIPQRLDFISAGEFPENPSELLSKNHFGQLIETLKPLYDLIIIDTPPVLAVTDASLLLKYSMNNFLVFNTDCDQLKTAQRVKNLLERNGIILRGIVFNTTHPGKSSSAAYDYAKYDCYYDYNQQTT